ncbi:hypothetical protein [Schleiferia thermophila]|nr:hypothetical protein [Schleiferia thermophila]
MFNVSNYLKERLRRFFYLIYFQWIGEDFFRGSLFGYLECHVGMQVWAV